jgi:multiple antibiotic resistance protein
MLYEALRGETRSPFPSPTRAAIARPSASLWGGVGVGGREAFSQASPLARDLATPHPSLPHKGGGTFNDMPLDFAITALVTLFVVVDPIGLAPTFLAVTEGLPRRARRDVAVRASLIAGAILIGTALLGDVLLRALGISLSAFRIAGGLLLFAIAFEMVLGVRMRREGQAAEEAVEEHVRNIAAFPLAIPLMAGPGAITATVLLAGRAYGQMLLVGLLLAVVVFVSLSCLATFLLAGRLSRMLGHTGNIVLSRLLGVLLAALAVQYVVDGIRAVLAG